jgi:hypothetical protein
LLIEHFVARNDFLRTETILRVLAGISAHRRPLLIIRKHLNRPGSHSIEVANLRQKSVLLVANTSGNTPTLDATTGTSHAIASSATSPNDSVSLGSSIRSEIDRISAMESCFPRKKTWQPSRLLRTTTQHWNGLVHRPPSATGMAPSSARDQRSQPHP